MQLTIDYRVIQRALVWATRKRRPLPDAALSFDQGMARVQLGPIDAEIPATGYWPLIAHFSGDWLRAVVKTPPADGVLSITYQGGRVFAGGFSAPAELRYPMPEESFIQNDQNLLRMRGFTTRPSNTSPQPNPFPNAIRLAEARASSSTYWGSGR